MKNFINSGLGILVLILLVYILFLRQCGNKIGECPPKNQVLVNKQTWDSIQALANKPPKVNTVIIKGKTIYIHQQIPIAKPDPKDSTINDYDTTLVKKDTIDTRIKLKVKGTILKWEWLYTPITKTITIEKYVPKIVDNPVPIPKNGFYISALIGGNKETFLFGGNLDLITKKNTVVGVIYQRWGKSNIYEFKLGTKISFKRR
jgi:hypothetical protein